MFYNFLQTLLSDIKMKLENVTKLENETKALDSLRKQKEEHNKELEETMEEVHNVWKMSEQIWDVLFFSYKTLKDTALWMKFHDLERETNRSKIHEWEIFVIFCQVQNLCSVPDVLVGFSSLWLPPPPERENKMTQRKRSKIHDRAIEDNKISRDQPKKQSCLF